MFLAIEKIQRQLKDVRAAIHREALDLPGFKYLPGDCPGAERPDFDDGGWADFRVGHTWGGYDQIAWFRARVAVPPAWRDGKLVLRFLVGPRDGGLSTAEAQLFVNGAPLQAIDVWHEEAWLPPEMLAAPELSIALRAWSGIYGVPDRRRFRLARLIRVDPAAESLYYLADTVLRVVRLQNESDLRRVALLTLLNDAWHRIDWLQTGCPRFYASLADAAGCLAAGLAAMPHDEPAPTVTAVGHSHIDMAWMWRLHHTREKAVRTFSTMLHLMRQYPEFRYTHSSPQLYQFVKEDAPEVYACVRERVAEGRWEVLGGSWVEFDTNLPGGEALVRQVLLGKRFTRAEFGRDPRVLWLPDSFGFSCVLPQLMKRSGLEYFCTAGISRSLFTHFPYDTFRWRGLDGSEVLAHLITTPSETGDRYTYNGVLSPEHVERNWRNYRQKDANAETLMTFGWGDGGGGPMTEMIEAARAQARIPGHPAVRIDTVTGFFDRLARRTAGRDLPVWDGELYLESARGAYTSQSRNKRANRRAETLYHAAEWMSALAGVLTADSAYPRDALRRGWERLLLLQFHDVLAGTSIHDVHEDSLADYARITAIGEQALAGARERLAAGIHTEQDSLIAWNALGWRRGGLAAVPWSPELAGRQIVGAAGRPLLSQVAEDEGRPVFLVELGDVPSLGYRAYPLAAVDPAPSPGEMIVAPDHLENAWYRIALNGSGQIVSMFDKVNGREVLAPGARGNVLQVYEDRSVAGEAWEIDFFYQEKAPAEVTGLVKAAVEEAGPLRGTLRLAWRFAASTIVQRLTIYRASPRIDFRTELDWHEHQVLLKAAFPVNVRTTHATYEVQFGAIERPTHWNTPWDRAHFENPAQKWADLSEGNYGVAVLNDCKHGYDVHDNVVRLTLHRCPTEPDPQADQGRHAFTYSLLPHAGTWRDGDVSREAYALNEPLRACVAPARPDGALPAEFELAAVNAGHVVIETVKQAEDGDGWIVRVYESRQCRNSAVHLRFGRPVRRAVECNLVEEDEQPVGCDGGTLTFAIAPYEIRTFKVWF